jgi:hypothetical protein
MNSKARISSFHESLIPLRALNLYSKKRNKVDVNKSIEKALEPFLSRKLFRRRSNDTIMNSKFTKLHYPAFWHYDILFGLKVMAEAGLIDDPRCKEALDLLESKVLADGGFPAEGKHYNSNNPNSTNIDWGGVNKKKPNKFVTKDAKFVLKKAGRLS